MHCIFCDSSFSLLSASHFKYISFYIFLYSYLNYYFYFYLFPIPTHTNSHSTLVSISVICTQSPILPLTCGPIPIEFNPPKEIPKGEIIEFNPIESDLKLFFEHFLEWLKPQSTALTMSSKSVTLLSAGAIPYVSTVEDLYTGIKVSQYCISNGLSAFKKDTTHNTPHSTTNSSTHSTTSLKIAAHNPPHNPPHTVSQSKLALTGMIEGFRYTHHIKNTYMQYVQGSSAKLGSCGIRAEGMMRAMQLGGSGEERLGQGQGQGQGQSQGQKQV